MDDENGDNGFDGYSTRTTIKEEVQAEMSEEMMQMGPQENENGAPIADVKTEIGDEARERCEKDREGKKDRDKDKERKKKSKRSSRERSRSKERERKRSRERRKSRSRSRDRGGRDRDRGERRYQIKYRYWDIPPAGYEHMTPKEYKELQVFVAVY